jgi:hypothetical protein
MVRIITAEKGVKGVTQRKIIGLLSAKLCALLFSAVKTACLKSKCENESVK